jgi:acyl carrier protein
MMRMADAEDPIVPIKRYILKEFLPGEREANLQEDTPLRTSGIIDSLGTIRLMKFIEDRFGIEVEAQDAGMDNFNSLRDISALVMRKRAARS